VARTLDPEGAHLEALRRFADFDGLRAVDDHDVRQYFPSGEELVEHVAQSLRSLPEASVPTLVKIERPCVVIERCRLRSLRLA
jgi:hypothetical protein